MADQDEPAVDLFDRWLAHREQTAGRRRSSAGGAAEEPVEEAVQEAAEEPTDAVDEPVVDEPVEADLDPLFDQSFVPSEPEQAPLFEASAPADVALPLDFEPVIIPSARKRNADARPSRRRTRPTGVPDADSPQQSGPTPAEVREELERVAAEERAAAEARRAAEAEQARRAEEAKVEAEARIAAQLEQARLAEQVERARLAEEAERARLAEEAEQARRAEQTRAEAEARIAAQLEQARRAREDADAARTPRATPRDPAPPTRTRERPAPAAQQADVAVASTDVASTDVVFRPRTGSRRLVGLLLLAVLVAAVGAAYVAWQDRTTFNVGVAVTLGVLTLVIWAARAGSATARLSVTGGQLVIERGGGRFVFDLASRYTPIEVVGEPGDRGWKVLFVRRSMAPFVVDASMVDPEEFMTVLRQYRPEDH